MAFTRRRDILQIRSAFAVVAAGVTLTACGLQPSDPSPTEPPSPCVSGECAPVGGLPGWRQVFVDEFDGAVTPGEWSGCSVVDPLVCPGLPELYRDRWWAFVEGWTDHSNGVYSPTRVLSVADGVLDVFIHSEDGVHLVAAPVPLINGLDGQLGQLYGRYEVRFRADALPGYKVAWLLWPDSEAWPRDGEIDFPEGNLDGDIEGYVHHQDGTAPNDQTGFATDVPLYGDWHTATIEWSPGQVVFILDDEEIGITTNRIPDTPMHWVLEVTTSLDGREPDDVTEGHVLIDWVVVYAPG